MTEATNTRREGMRPWPGGTKTPADWDGGPVLLRNGYLGEANHWGRDAPAALGYEGDNDIIAYTPQTSDGSGSGSWVPAEQLVQANERIAELEGALREMVEEVDFEIEQRKDGGNEEDWAILQAKSDRAHAALRAKGGAA